MTEVKTQGTARQNKLLEGKVALITGSTSGIGLGIARRLGLAGCNVVLNGLMAADEVERVKAQLAEDCGQKVLYHGADMTRPSEISQMVEFAVQELGAVDILVNNAGIQHTALVEEFPTEKWDAILAINLSSAFHSIGSAIPHMKRKGWGRVVNIASAHGLVASASKAAYVAAKHARLAIGSYNMGSIPGNALHARALPSLQSFRGRHIGASFGWEGQWIHAYNSTL